MPSLLRLVKSYGKSEVPAGWCSIADLSKKLKITEKTAGDRVRALKTEGKVEEKRFMVLKGKRCLPVAHYKAI